MLFNEEEEEDAVGGREELEWLWKRRAAFCIRHWHELNRIHTADWQYTALPGEMAMWQPLRVGKASDVTRLSTPGQVFKLRRARLQKEIVQCELNDPQKSVCCRLHVNRNCLGEAGTVA